MNTPLSEQSNDSKECADNTHTMRVDTSICVACGFESSNKTPTPTDTNTSFKKELEKILDRYQFHFTHQFTHKEDPFTKDQALTSIINLVDKVIGEDEVAEGESVRTWKEPELESFRLRNIRDGLRAEQRAIIRGK